MAFLESKAKENVITIFKALKNSINVSFFTQGNACASCRDQQALLEEVVSLTVKINLKIYDFVKKGDIAIPNYAYNDPRPSLLRCRNPIGITDCNGEQSYQSRHY